MLSDFILMILMLIIGVVFCVFEILRDYIPAKEINEEDKHKILSIFSIIGVRHRLSFKYSKKLDIPLILFNLLFI